MSAGGASAGGLTANTFKTISASSIGSTALWTPGSGKKFRILGFSVFIPSNATTAAGSVVTLKDGAATVFNIAALGTTTGVVAYGVKLPGNGYRSTTTDNVLNVDCSAAITAAAVYVNAWGVEE